MKLFSRDLQLLLLLGVAACSPGSSHPADPPKVSIAASAARGAQLRHGFAEAIATSVDERRGVPRFLWASTRQPAQTRVTAVAAARSHLGRHAPAFGVARAVVDDAEHVFTNDRGRGGIVVGLRQRVGGIEVYRGEVKVLMRRNLDLVAISGSPHRPPRSPGRFELSRSAALAVALADHFGLAVQPEQVREVAGGAGDYARFELADALAIRGTSLRFSEPARVKPVLFPSSEALLPAYFVELFAGPEDAATSDAYRYLVAAADGQVLERRNLTASQGYHRSSPTTYRVWAHPSGDELPSDRRQVNAKCSADRKGSAPGGFPRDNPQEDFTPHPTGVPDDSRPGFVAPIVVECQGFNTNPEGEADPWLSRRAGQTLGNNVDAYADINNPDGFSNGDLRAAPQSRSNFDFVYDTSADPLATTDQTMASVTQLFYVTNWLHDWYYDSGFDEAAGNAQSENYDRGGLGDDPLKAEAQNRAYSDYQRDNANMTTPADGVSPRMQVLIWSGPERRSLVVPGVSEEIATNTAEFGLQEFALSGELSLADDGIAPVSDGCEALGGGAAGTMVVVDRGLCTFKQKAVNAEAAGAIGLLVANNEAGDPPGMADGDPEGEITIPVFSIDQQAGDAIKAVLNSGGVTASMQRHVDVERDGALDSTLVAHEWGHFLHFRLADCNQLMCYALSEGFADFVALHLIVRDGDDLAGTFAAAIYAGGGSSVDGAYFGIRRAPYSTDLDKNGFTFKHISSGEPLPAQPLQDFGVDNAEVHNAGEVWTMMLFEAYASLLAQTQGPGATRSFAEAQRTMSDYLVAGLQLMPLDATYTEARDAILAAAAARSLDDMATLAAGFARRGAGSCAESPPRDSEDFVGVVESYEVRPRIEIAGVTLDDSASSCDGDGVLDQAETGTLRVRVLNTGAAPLDSADLAVSTATAGVEFPAGTTLELGTIQPFGEATAALAVALDGSLAATTLLDLQVSVSSASACAPTVTRDAVFRTNYDEQPDASATDDVESTTTAWKVTGADGEAVWARLERDAAQHVWHGLDLGWVSDAQLESPALQVSPTGGLVMVFSHRHQFEEPSWDGGVVELSADDGATWQDISDLADPGYSGIVDRTSGNPLAGRQAYLAENAAWPLFDQVSLDLGDALAGKTVLVRFRVGSDQALGAHGWEIDHIRFEGIDNLPFTALVDDRAEACRVPPEAEAGPDGVATAGTVVLLDGSASSDANGDPLQFQWTQVAGPAVTILDDASAIAAFLAPAVIDSADLHFELAVSDGSSTSRDTVRIFVVPETGCGCEGEAGVCRSGSPWLPAGAGLLFLLRRRRRARAAAARDQ